MIRLHSIELQFIVDLFSFVLLASREGHDDIVNLLISKGRILSCQ
jgi:hypothetical protein